MPNSHRDVRPRPGRYRADLRADRARMLSPIRSRQSGRLGVVVDAGMAIGGWMSGAIFDATLSYRAAFLNGFAWNLLNMAIAAWLLLRLPRRRLARFA